VSQPPPPKPGFENSREAVPGSLLGWLDHLMASHPANPRFIPLLVYLLFLTLIGFVRDMHPWAYSAVYLAQCGTVGWLLWRYRKLVPEMTLGFHWTVIPSALFLTAAWIYLAKGMIWLAPEVFDSVNAEHPFAQLRPADQSAYLLSITARLLGMSLLVPLFEEIFVRSLILRALTNARRTGMGVIQFIHDLPGVGDLVMDTKIGRKAGQMDPVFTAEFRRHPVGVVTWFGIAASTFVFMLSHIPRDWPGCIACGIVWCLMVKWTNPNGARQGPTPVDDLPQTHEDDVACSRPLKGDLGLGPVIWSHGLVNALLWTYVIVTGDWRFL